MNLCSARLYLTDRPRLAAPPRLLKWSLLGILLMLSSAQAGIVTIEVNALGGQRHFADALGTGLPNGNQIRVGTFNAGFETDVNNGDLVALHSKFNQIYIL